ncbi:MAG: MltA domain-containing protein [Magnetococcales bacterium]|nr:MltA domain-containing protein [Magnetococcales bacterium]
MRYMRWLPILLLIVLAGCQAKPLPEIAEPPKAPEIVEDGERFSDASLESVSWSEISPSLFQDRQLNTWADALTQSSIYYRRIPADKRFSFAGYTVSAAQMARACTELAELARSNDPARLKKELQQRFRLFRSVGGNSKKNVLVTGYYEPLLHGSFTRSKRYFYPIYRRPPDLLDAGNKGGYRLVNGKRERYFTRSQIDERFLSKTDSKKLSAKLANRGLELVWVDNPIDAFFLHIQGSGRVKLDTGELMRIGYDGTNGRTYTAIGRILISEGKIPHEEMTMPRLRQWLVDNPRENQRLFFANPSYVFFRKLSGESVGNINVPLTKDRSIATDHRLFPKGAPAIISTTIPELAPDGKTVASWRPEVRFVVNQDTGGAIRGPGRVDLFFGYDEQVEYRAGVMKQNGSSLYFIAPRPDRH